MSEGSAVLLDERFDAALLADMALGEFRARVQRWANSFDPKYRTLCYVLGTLVSLKTGIAQCSQTRLLERMQEAYDAQGNGVVAPRRTWLQSRLGELKDASIVDAWQPRTAQEWSDRPAFRSNRYAVDFSRIIRGGEVAHHDFMADLAPSNVRASTNSERSTEHSTGRSTEHVPSHAHLSSILQQGPAAAFMHLGTATGHDWRPDAIVWPGEELSQEAMAEVRKRWDELSWADVTSHDWWLMAFLLANTFERPVDSRQLRRTFEQVLPDYTHEFLSGARMVGEFMVSRNLRDAANPIGYLLSTFPVWLAENYCTTHCDCEGCVTESGS